MKKYYYYLLITIFLFMIAINNCNATIDKSAKMNNYKVNINNSELLSYKVFDGNDENYPKHIDLKITKDMDLCDPNNSRNGLTAFKVLGYVILVLKILVPLAIIIFASLDFAKAVISGEDKAISEKAYMLLKRTIAGVAIFFIPTVLDVTFNTVNGANDSKNSFKNCEECLYHPGRCNN